MFSYPFKFIHCTGQVCGLGLRVTIMMKLMEKIINKLKYLSIPHYFRFGECSQICNVKKDGNHTCSCAPGYFLNSYSQKRQKSCSAQGNYAYMIVANDNLLQKLSPYKHGNSAGTLPLTTVLEFWMLGCQVKVCVYCFSNKSCYAFSSLYMAVILFIVNIL